MKTVRQHLNDLKEPERTASLKAMYDGDEEEMVSSLADALYFNVTWKNDRNDLLEDTWDKLNAGTYFDAPQITQESCMEAARKTMHGLPKRMATDEDYEKLDEIAPESICQEAQRIQGGDRQQDYGSPAKNFQDIADLWSTYIKTSLDVDVDIKARDVAHMSILMKISRNVHKPKRDNWVDMAGYAQCGGKVDEL